MNGYKVDQSNNLVKGDVAGRDVNHITRHLSLGSQKSSVSAIQFLYKKYEIEQSENPQLKKIVEDLESYRQNIDVEVIGLEQKLIDGNQTSSIEYAARAKEVFYKRLIKYEMSEMAQKISVHLLGKIESRFIYYIYPKICLGDPEEEIKVLVQELLVDYITEYLEDNPLELNSLDINGMLYFLTGNCHIKWTK